MRFLFPVFTGVFIFIASSTCWGQDINSVGPANVALGGVKSIDPSNWAALTNVANLALQTELSAGISYQRKFQLSELSLRMATVNYPRKLGVLTGLVLQSGFEKSLLSRYAFSFSRSFGSKVSAGLQFNYLTHQIEGAELVDAFYSSIGILIQPTSSIHLAAFVQNPEQGTIRYYDSVFYLPSSFCLGIQWSADPHVLILVELEKESDRAPIYKTGVQFNFKNQLFLRTGLSAKPATFAFGGGFRYNFIVIDVAFANHAPLGLTSSFGLSFFIGNSK